MGLGDELSRSLLDLTTMATFGLLRRIMRATQQRAFHRAKICWMTWTWRSIWEKRPPQSEKKKRRRAEKQQRRRRRRFEQTQRECTRKKKRREKRRRQQRKRKRLLLKLRS